MDRSVWTGVLLTAGVGSFGWLVIQLVNYIQGLHRENKRLREEDEKLLKKNMDVLSKELQLTTLAVAKLDVKLANVEKFGGMLYSMNKDLEELKKWKEAVPSIDTGDPDKDS